MAEFEKINFCIDSLPEDVFPGYSNGETWNGFACPYFQKDVAERVLRTSETNGYSWRYDTIGDAFIVRNMEDPPEFEPEVFEGLMITVGDNQVKVYPIGAYSWIWGDCA